VFLLVENYSMTTPAWLLQPGRESFEPLLERDFFVFSLRSAPGWREEDKYM
jgi:hypothetical protein